MVLPVLQIFMFSCTSIPFRVPCQLVSSPASRPPPWIHDWHTGTWGHCSSSYGVVFILYQLIFLTCPRFGFSLFWFDSQIQYYSLIHSPHPSLPIFCQFFPSPGHSKSAEGQTPSSPLKRIRVSISTFYCKWVSPAGAFILSPRDVQGIHFVGGIKQALAYYLDKVGIVTGTLLKTKLCHEEKQLWVTRQSTPGFEND